MTLEQAKNLEPGTVIDCGDVSMKEILKRISDGYIVFEYEGAHYVFNPIFISFEEIVESKYEVNENEWDREIFDAEYIQHIDDFGFCKLIR